jgi:prophage regulatory protein
MAPNGGIVMKLLSKKAVRERVCYSPQHTARLEKAGKFPKRVRLGQGRVGYVEEEIDQWILDRIAERDALKDNS